MKMGLVIQSNKFLIQQAKTETTPSSSPHLPTPIQRATSSPSVITEPPPTFAPEPPVPQTQATAPQPLQNSLVVSVPLANTSLSPISTPSVATANPTTLYQHLPERVERSPVPTTSLPTSDITMVSSDGGLKITYEKQPTPNSMNRLSSETPPTVEETPAKRSRSHSADKPERLRKKRGSNGVPILTGPASGAGKRTSRSQHNTPPPSQLGAFSSVSQPATIVKSESPPSSASDENCSTGIY